MYCPNCGKKTSELLCPKCGYDLRKYNLDGELYSSSKNISKKRIITGFQAFIITLSISMAIALTIALVCIEMSNSKFDENTDSGLNAEIYSEISNNSNDLNVIDETNISPSVDSSKITSSTNKETSPIDISKITFHINILPPDSIGNVYAEFTYDNYTGYDITYLSVKALLKDKNKKAYYTCVDTVLSGETSPIFDSFGPDTQSLSDIDFLECQIVSFDNNGKRISIKYDYKLKTYDIIQ